MNARTSQQGSGDDDVAARGASAPGGGRTGDGHAPGRGAPAEDAPARGVPSRLRPFRVLGLQQVAIGGPSKARLRTLWVDKLGLEVTGQFRSERENVDEDICTLGRGAARVEVDLMEPIDPAGKPAVHTTPLNHIGLWIDDLRQAVDWLEQEGVRFAPGGIRKGAAGHDVCFLHPKANEQFPVAGEGVLIELVQAPPDVIDAFETGARVPSAVGR